MRFLVVTHEWFVDSRGFKVEEIEASDEKQAQERTDLLTYRAQDSHKRAASKLIILEDTESFINRKLTWTERLTGKLEV